MKILRGVLVWLLAASAARPQSVDQIMASLGEISGMKATRSVPQARMTREQMRAFFDKRIKHAIKPEQMRIEELALKKFGLVPGDFDLGRTTLDLLSEQAAAFYDYEKGYMVMGDGGTGALEQMALVHELAHALADQHYPIGKYMRGGNSAHSGANKEVGEPTLARQAVVEGQAQWLTSEYMARQMGQSLLTSPALANLLSGAMEPSGQYPVYDKVPQYLRESMVFPYSAGMQFQQAVIRKLGPSAFARVFENPPLDSHEILHPIFYLERGAPAAPVKAPDMAEGGKGKDWKEISEGAVGEFDHLMMLKLYAKDQIGLAPEWRAAHYRLWEAKRKRNGAMKAVALTYSVRWSSPEAAARYLTAYRRVLAGKWTDFQMEAESEQELRGTGGGGRFEVKLAGDTVVSREGLPLSTLKP